MKAERNGILKIPFLSFILYDIVKVKVRSRKVDYRVTQNTQSNIPIKF